MKLWEDNSHTLWSAALYPEKDTIEEAVKAALNLYALVNGEDQADLSAWKEAQKKSLCSGFNDADPDAIIAWNKRMADLVAMDEIAKAIRNKVPAAKLRKRASLTKIQKEWLERRIRKADFSEKMRLQRSEICLIMKMLELLWTSIQLNYLFASTGVADGVIHLHIVTKMVVRY